MARDGPATTRTRSHEHYQFLCALYTVEELPERILDDLATHLAICQDCRQAMRDYFAIAKSLQSLGAKLHETTYTPTSIH